MSKLKSNYMKFCYNCGIELTKENRTKEHIPAQNTFIGYPPEYKLNRLTVPACLNCNNQYSKIDEEIRDAIGIMNDDDSKQAELTRKAVESMMRNKDWSSRLDFKDGRVESVSFSYDTFKRLHIKNFKGLFYDKYGFPLPEEYQIEIIAEGDFENTKLDKIAQLLAGYLADGGNFNVSGHPDIFQYKLKTLTPMSGGDLINDSATIENALGVVGILIYHKNIEAIIIAAKKDFLENIHTKKE